MIKKGNGIIIRTKIFGESGKIITICNDDNQLLSGLVKKIARNSHNKYEIGNLVNYQWTGRDGTLGVFSIEVIKSYASLYISRKTQLITTITACEMTYVIKNGISNLYHQSFFLLLDLLSNINQLTNADVIKEYLGFEKSLFALAGYGEINNNALIDLDQQMKLHDIKLPNSRIMFNKLL